MRIMPKDSHGFERADNEKCPKCQRMFEPGEDTIEFGIRGEAIKLHQKCFERFANRFGRKGRR